MDKIKRKIEAINKQDELLGGKKCGWSKEEQQ